MSTQIQLEFRITPRHFFGDGSSQAYDLTLMGATTLSLESFKKMGVEKSIDHVFENIKWQILDLINEKKDWAVKDE